MNKSFDYLQTLNQISQAEADYEVGLFSFLEFRVGSENCYLRLENVKEVVKNPSFSPVALMKDWFLGLLRVQNDICSVVYLDGFLGNAKLKQPPRFAIVLASELGSYALAVNEVNGIYQTKETLSVSGSEGYFDTVSNSDRSMKIVSLDRLLKDQSFNSISVF